MVSDGTLASLPLRLALPSFSYRRVQSDNREFHIIACKEARWGFIRGSCCSRCKYGIGSYGLRIRRGFSLGSSLCFCFGRSGCQILEPGRRVGLIGRRQGGGIYNWTLERRIGLIGWWWTEPDCADHERGNGASSLHSWVRMNLIGKEMAGLWKKRNAIIQRRDILVLATRSLCRQLAMGSPARGDGSDSSTIDVLRMAFG